MPKVAIIGGGIAGCTTAIQLAKQGHQVVIIEQEDDILQGTSARTPGRMGLGYHYFDSDTAKRYMRQTVEFMKHYQDCFLGDDSTLHLMNGRYFIVKDSLIGTQDLMASYDEVSGEFEKMCREDEANDIFETTHLHRALREAEFKDDVNFDNVAYAIETKERLLDWGKFSAKLKLQVEECGIEIRHQTKVGNASQRLGGGFVLYTTKQGQEMTKNISPSTSRSTSPSTSRSTSRSTSPYITPPSSFDSETSSFLSVKLEEKTNESFDYVVNCSWQNIEFLDEKIGIGNPSKKNNPQETTTSRLKLLAEVKLPESLQKKPSMFFCVGPHAMFSNLGNGIGRITYAPITNFGTTTDSKMPEQFERWLSKGLTEEETTELGQKIIDGVAKYIPTMKDAELIKVIPGIVKSKGSVDINDKDSPFHKRDYSGVEEQQIGWIDNAAMKLFYCLGNAKEVTKLLKKQELSKPQINKIIDFTGFDGEWEDLETYEQRLIQQFLVNHLQRNFKTSDLLGGKAEDIKESIQQTVGQKSEIGEEIKNFKLSPKTSVEPNSALRLLSQNINLNKL